MKSRFIYALPSQAAAPSGCAETNATRKVSLGSEAVVLGTLTRGPAILMRQPAIVLVNAMTISAAVFAQMAGVNYAFPRYSTTLYDVAPVRQRCSAR